ncbi:TPA: hypothetical protein ACGOX5_000038 [Streptococcus suis]
MTSVPIFSMEIVLIKRLNFKNEFKNFISAGFTEIFEFFDLLVKNTIEADSANKVYHVQYKNGKEVSRRLLSISYHDFKQLLLTKNKYLDSSYKYIFLKKTIKYY